MAARAAHRHLLGLEPRDPLPLPEHVGVPLLPLLPANDLHGVGERRLVAGEGPLPYLAVLLPTLLGERVLHLVPQLEGNTVARTQRLQLLLEDVVVDAAVLVYRLER